MEQNTEEWRAFRCKRLTASRFGDVLANPKTKRYRYYMDDVIEGLQGFTQFDKYEPWFDHGKEWENEGRGNYEWEKDVTVEPGGVIVHPDYDFISCSPDGRILKNGGIEIKSRSSLKQHLKTVRCGMDTVYKPQVQGTLWIAKWDWIDFVSFYKGKDKTLLHIYRVIPDLKYHKKLKEACLSFWNEIQRKLKS